MQLGGSCKWTNVDTQQSVDINQDHILMQLGISLNHPTSLEDWRPHDIADGKVHAVKVQYLPHAEMQYFELMTASKNLILYLKDIGKGRSIGTLAVFVDKWIVEDRPLLALPVNLSILLDLHNSLAYVGFTASTGWQMDYFPGWYFLAHST
jgi:hypothetical protein